MTPGSRVRRRRDGAIGKVLRVEGDDLVVEVSDGDVRRWQQSSAHVIGGERAPRGVATVTEAQRQALAMLRGGADRRAIAARMGVSRDRVDEYIARACEAEREARNLELLSR